MTEKETLIILLILLCISIYFISRPRCVRCTWYDDSWIHPYWVCTKCKEELKKIKDEENKIKERSKKMKNIY